MSEAKFTKGPWIRRYHANGCNYVSANEAHLNGCYSVANCSGPDEIANAHLIAAAPEMYAFINKLTIGLANDFPSLRDSAIEILAKARGE